MKMTVFWVVTLYNLVEVYQSFRGTCCSIIKVMNKLCMRNQFEIQEPVSQGRTLARPMGNEGRIG
jgi:hypothetical protein